MAKIKPGGEGGDKPAPLEGNVKSATVTPRGLTIVVRLKNPNDRPLHVIGAPRALLYDAATRKLTVRLTDRGRVLVPGGLERLPTFRVIDPRSDAEISVDLPETIVKLADIPSASGELAMVEHRIADAADIQLELAWADIPFYQDPRHTDDAVLPAVRWQQGELHVTHKLERKK